MASVAVTPGIGDRLGEILLSENLVTREQLTQALTEQKSSGHRLGYVLIKLGLIPEVEITKVLARQHRMPAVDLTRFEVDGKILKLDSGRRRPEARRPAAQARGPDPDGGHGRSVG